MQADRAELGTEDHPYRVAVIGAGPTGFYAAEHLLKQPFSVSVDVYDRLPTPFGLVRGGVAPDHQKIKLVTRVFDRVADHDGFRFFGNVEFGRHVSLEDLKGYYHHVFFATGAQTDRNLNIPGEDFIGSYSATEFVAWYNGHPDFRDHEFDLSGHGVAVIGVGNVAVDVARILARSHRELLETDIADYALEALRDSGVKDIYMLGRRGPAQAAFTNPEIKELGELEAAAVTIPPEEAELDPISAEQLEKEGDRSTDKKVRIIQSYAGPPDDAQEKRITLRFLVSPTEILADEQGRVKAIRIVKNELYEDEHGRVRPRATEKTEELPVQLVFRSVGYRGVPLPDIPFDERWGVILNEKGRVLDAESREPLMGLYAGGWIKRGATGVIGTNKPDAIETVDCMLEDLREGRHFDPEHVSPERLTEFVEERQPCFFSYADWQRLDELETGSGQSSGRPRVKFTSIGEMCEVLGKKEVGSVEG